MKKTAIVTDTTACILPGQVKEFGIEIVPVPLIIDEKTYRDGIDITPAQFYELMRKAKKAPSTSASSPEPYLEAFKNASKQAESVICFTEPARFSAMYVSAMVAKKTAENVFPGVRVEVIECTTAAAGMGLVVLEAARQASKGKTLEEVKETAVNVMHKVRLYAAINTLQYLVKSGRVPQAAALLNSLLSIKPIFTLNGGEAKTVSLPRTMRGALDRMFKILNEETKAGQELHVVVMHAESLTNAETLKEQIFANFNCKEIYITEFTPVMGAHTGPGLVGVAFWGEG